MFLFATLAEATQYVNFHDLMGDNSAIAFSVFGLPIRWYALAYLAGIFVGYWYLTKLIDQPGSPMARRHADDMIFYAMLGIILGGRIGYVLFYNLESYIRDPAAVFRLWDGGMSLHGGPGRAGGGEELGGLRALNFYHRRSAVQAGTAVLDALAAAGSPSAA